MELMEVEDEENDAGALLTVGAQLLELGCGMDEVTVEGGQV